MTRMVSEQELVAAARAAAGRAYAPYSRFPVGAALLTAAGEVFTGVNVENSSYGLTICAERVAVFSAVSAGRRRFRKLAVVAGSRQTVAPCGACLQVLSEFCGPAFPILLARLAPRSPVAHRHLGDFLPRAFKFNSGRVH